MEVPFILVMTSPALSPASSAGYPFVTLTILLLSTPIEPITKSDNKNARMKLNKGPPKTVHILTHTDLLAKAPSSSLDSSSPSIMQEPPIGRSFTDHFVPAASKEKSLGPIPSENSFTLIPPSLAKK